MIVGMGVDVVSLSGFAPLLEAPSTFEREHFSPDERAYAAEATGSRVEHLAARWAAKEAALKALDHAAALAGTEPGEVRPREIEVARDARGRPAVRLHGAAARLAEETGADRAMLSLSHDGDVAVAVVAFERLPLTEA